MKARSSLVLALAFGVLITLAAADWPQWRGPHRDDISADTGLLPAWPREGPKLLWTYANAGTGYASFAIVKGRLYSMGARDNSEDIFAVDLTTGKELWSSPLGPLFENAWGDGPRGTPTVDGDVLYAIGGQGQFACVDLATGKQRWTLNLRTDLGGQMMSGWGYTESPLVDGDHLICSPGGSRGTLAALDKKTGKDVWRSTELKDAAAYSSVIVADVGGVRQYIQMTSTGIVGVAAKDGRLLWHSDIGANGTAVIPTPVFHDGYVYVTSGYEAGCGLLKLTPDGDGTRAEKVYANKNMKNHHGGVVLVDKHIYGFSDGQGWICQDFLKGDIVWSEKRRLGKGSLTYADGHLYCYSEADGSVILAAASPEKWKESGRFRIPRQTTADRKRGHVWTHPVVAEGKLFLRDQELIFCYDVREGSVQNSFQYDPALDPIDLSTMPETDAKPGLPTWVFFGGGVTVLALLVVGLALLRARRR